MLYVVLFTISVEFLRSFESAYRCFIYIVSERIDDNISCSVISIIKPGSEIKWTIKAESQKDEKLNSMQKITALYTAGIISLMSENIINMQGIIFSEILGRDKKIFKHILSFLKNNSIKIIRE